MPRLLPFLVYLGLVTFALSSAWQRPERDPYGVPKWLWALIIVFLPYVGAIAWILLNRRRPDSGPTRQSRPIAPDDDPEYLAWLREQSRRRRQSGEKG